MVYRNLFLTVIALTGFSVLPPAFGAGDIPACTDCPTLLPIAPGHFSMGASPDERGSSPDEHPRHDVTISHAYSIGRTQVTRGQFAEFVRATDLQVEPGCWALTQTGWQHDPSASWRAPGFPQKDDHPAVCVSQEDALAYLSWLSASSSQTYRLPTEAEWEHAARGTGAQPFWGFQENICTYGNVNDITSKNKVARVGENCIDGAMHTAAVATYKANPNGLFDMIGNAWEWTADCASDDYTNTPIDGSAWVSPVCTAHTLRGHSWTDAPGPVRIETRYALPATARQSMVGFRVAAD